MKPGLEYEFRWRVPESKTVPALYPEAAEFQEMPCVFATGYLVGLLEWGQGRRLFFQVEAHDGVDLISKGTHQRYVIDRARFTHQAALKASSSRSRFPA
jgi:fluoroacetyl-CoA thioesterase